MEHKLRTIVEYIHEKKGVWITPIPPMNERQMMLLEIMYGFAMDYNNKK